MLVVISILGKLLVLLLMILLLLLLLLLLSSLSSSLLLLAIRGAHSLTLQVAISHVWQVHDGSNCLDFHEK